MKSLDIAKRQVGKGENQCWQQWKAAARRSYLLLEKCDRRRLEEFRNLADIEAGLRTLQEEFPPGALVEVLSPIHTTLEAVALLNTFVLSNFGEHIDTAIIWGLLYLLIDLSAKEQGAISRVVSMLKTIGHKIELFNEYCSHQLKPDTLKQAGLDVQIEIISFFTSAVCFFRNVDPIEHNPWQPLMESFTSASKNIDGSIERVEKLLQAGRRIEDFSKLQLLLSLPPGSGSNEAKLPCKILPVSRSSRFYDRDNLISRIDAHFHNLNSTVGLRSLTLYGLGGVGKSHVALKYADRKNQELDAVLWVYSETAAALEQSFTNISLRLKLPGAEAKKAVENKILVLDWLQQTSCKWLLIFDNVESVDLLLMYWPIANHGYVLITTRNRSLAFEPAETGIEVKPFDPEVGSQLLLHLLSLDIAADVSHQEAKSAYDLAEIIGGHALMISQMASMIHRRSWSIEEFLQTYNRNTQKMQNSMDAIDALWKISFQSLDPASSAFLGVLCYLMPDSITQSLFEVSDSGVLPKSLQFCGDEFRLFEILDTLFTSSLINRDKTTRTFSLHRLVQDRFRFFLSPDGRQEAFENAAWMLHEAFPQLEAKKGQLYDRWTQCQLYSQHVISLRKGYKDALDSEPLKPTLLFCKLLKNFARFLLESASYEELEVVLHVARIAFDKLDAEQQDQTLLADISGSMGLLWAHRGFFDRAEPFLRNANTIRARAVPLDRIGLSWTEVNMANLMASKGQFHDSLHWQLKALANRQSVAGYDYAAIKFQGINYQNIGRSKVLLGLFVEADIWCSMALAQFNETKNWGMVAYTHFVLGNLRRAGMDFDTARQEYSKAQAVWLDCGSMKTHHFNGACLYKLGCVAFDLGDNELALKRLQEALIIAQLHQRILSGDYARVLFKLSQVSGNEGRAHWEDERRRNKARSLRSATGHGATNDSPEDEKSYDEMVYILWR